MEGCKRGKAKEVRPLIIKSEKKRGNSYMGKRQEVWRAKHHVNREEERLQGASCSMRT